MNRVILWENGMVMVFDGNGKQMPEYQGAYQEVRDKILADAEPDVLFQRGRWSGVSPEIPDAAMITLVPNLGAGLTEITREQFAETKAPPFITGYSFLDAGSRCDFCLIPGPVPAKDYRARDFITGEVDGQFIIDDGTWRACLLCANLIESRSWEKLLDRGVEGAMTRSSLAPIANTAINRRQIRKRQTAVLKAVFGVSP